MNVYAIANKDYSLVKKGHILAAEQFVFPCLNKFPVFTGNGEIEVIEKIRKFLYEEKMLLLSSIKKLVN